MNDTNGVKPVGGLDAPLADRMRRHLLYCLTVYENPMKLPSVADQLTIWKENRPEEDEYFKERCRIYDSLYYEHLPALREAGLVEYHQQDDMVELGATIASVETALKSHLTREIDDLLEAEEKVLNHEDS